MNEFTPIYVITYNNVINKDKQILEGYIINKLAQDKLAEYIKNGKGNVLNFYSIETIYCNI